MLVSCKTFQDVSKNTTKEGFGLLPVENSLVGTVVEAYESLIEHNLEIYLETSVTTYLRFVPLADFCSFNCCDTTIVRNQVVPSSKLTGSVGYYHIIFNRGFAQKFITMLLSLK